MQIEVPEAPLRPISLQPTHYTMLHVSSINGKFRCNIFFTVGDNCNKIILRYDQRLCFVKHDGFVTK